MQKLFSGQNWSAIYRVKISKNAILMTRLPVFVTNKIFSNPAKSYLHLLKLTIYSANINFINIHVFLMCVYANPNIVTFCRFFAIF